MLSGQSFPRLLRLDPAPRNGSNCPIIAWHGKRINVLHDLSIVQQHPIIGFVTQLSETVFAVPLNRLISPHKSHPGSYGTKHHYRAEYTFREKISGHDEQLQ